MLVFLGFLLTIFLGLLLILVIVPKMHPLEKLGASYALGLGLLTLLMFFYSLVGFRFTLINTLIALLIPILILLPLTKKKIKTLFVEIRSKFSFSQLSPFEKILTIAICLFLLCSLISTLYWPVYEWDAIALYDWRAKVFADTGFMDEAIKRGYFFGYPLLTSLAHTWVFILGGKNPQFIYTLFFASFVAMFYGTLRLFTSRSISLMAGFLLVATSVLFGHSTFAYTNLPYTVYFVMGTIYIYLWMVEPKKGYLILSALMIGLSTWTRSSEPFWLANLVILVLYSLAKRKILAPIFYSLVFFSIQQPWRIYLENKITYSSIPAQIQTSLSVFTFGIDLGRITNVAAFIYDSIVVSWQPLLFLFLLVVFLELKNHFRNQSLLFLGLILANFLLLVSGVYIFAFSHPDWQDIPGSATRMSMFFIPLFIFYIFSSKKVEEIFNGK